MVQYCPQSTIIFTSVTDNFKSCPCRVGYSNLWQTGLLEVLLSYGNRSNSLFNIVAAIQRYMSILPHFGSIAFISIKHVFFVRLRKARVKVSVLYEIKYLKDGARYSHSFYW